MNKLYNAKEVLSLAYVALEKSSKPLSNFELLEAVNNHYNGRARLYPRLSHNLQASYALDRLSFEDTSNTLIVALKKIVATNDLHIHHLKLLLKLPSLFKDPLKHMFKPAQLPNIGDKVTIEATVKDKRDFMGRKYGKVTFLSFYCEQNGNIYTYLCSNNAWKVQIGETISLIGTVKRTYTYNSRTQIQLTHCKKLE